MRHVGLGDQLEKLERLRAKLRAEGLFDARRKRPLPFLPHVIGLITGEKSDAEKDVRHNAELRWPHVRFRMAYASVQGDRCVPETIGALNLFRAEPGPLPDADRSLAQALADVATIGILQERGSRRREVLAEQLQDALTSRIVIEQAKGVIAERLGVHVDEAFAQMRGHARSHGERLSEVARRVVSRELDLTADASRRTSSKAPRGE